MTPNNSVSYGAQQSDHDGNNSLGDLFVALQTYHMEFDVQSPVARLPQCFVREFGDKIALYVMLRDPNHNEFEVHVSKKSNEMYFDDGWSALKHIYNICFGAWVTFSYLNYKVLTIRLSTRWGAQVKYPTYNPPLKRLLARVRLSPSMCAFPLSNTSNGPVSQKSFVRTFIKKMSFYDIHSGTLILPWFGFGEGLFDLSFSDLVLIDWCAKQYPCKLKCDVDAEGQLACKISVGWFDLCNVHGLVVDDRVSFCVPESTHNYRIYVSLYPRMRPSSTMASANLE